MHRKDAVRNVLRVEECKVGFRVLENPTRCCESLSNRSRHIYVCEKPGGKSNGARIEKHKMTASSRAKLSSSPYRFARIPVELWAPLIHYIDDRISTIEKST